jgi:DNA repair exonuclease SbcCD ATPase subunit
MELTIQNIDLPAEYGITDGKIAEIAAKYRDLTEIKDSASLAMAVAGRREARDLRVAVEKRRKELKADALDFGRKVDGEAKRITDQLRGIEDPLDGLIKADEARREEERQAKLRAIAEAEAKERARIDGIRAAIEARFGDSVLLALTGMGAKSVAYRISQEAEITEVDGFGEFADEARERQRVFLAKADAIHSERLAAEEEAERQRIEGERLAEERRVFEEERRLQAEQRQQEQAEAQRLEAERQAAIEAEQEKIEAERRKLREEQEAIEAEKRRIEEERQAKIREEEEAKRRAEMEEQARIRAEQELKERQEREEQERKDREEAEQLAKEREEMLRPDKEKIKVLALDLHALQYPTVTTAEGIKAIERIKKKVYALADFVSQQADKLAEVAALEVA